MIYFDIMEKHETNKKSSYAMIILAGILWGTIGLFVRYFTAAGFSHMQMIAVRSYVTTAILFVFLLLRHPEKLKVRLRDCGWFIGMGIISFVFFNFCYFNAISLTSLSTAAILLYTSPVFVMLLSIWLFKEKMTRPKLLALVLAFLGCAFTAGLLGGQMATSGPGIAFGLGSGFLYALYSIFGRYALRRYSPLTVTAYTFLFASLGATPFAAIQGTGITVDITAGMVGLLVLFGVVTALLPYVLYTKGLAGVETGKAAIVASVEPVVATVVGVLFFGELLSPTGILGIAMVVAAIVILNIPRKCDTMSNTNT